MVQLVRRRLLATLAALLPVLKFGRAAAAPIASVDPAPPAVPSAGLPNRLDREALYKLIYDPRDEAVEWRVQPSGWIKDANGEYYMHVSRLPPLRSHRFLNR